MASPLLTAGLAAAQGVSNMITGFSNARRQSRENAMAREYDFHMWNNTNEYNKPINQMARLKEAGINPHLAYMNGDTGDASQSGGLQAGTAPEQGLGNSLSEALESYTRQENMNADTKLKEAQAEKTKAETKSVTGEEGRKKDEHPLNLQKLSADIENLNKNSEYTSAKIESEKSNNEYIKAQTEKIDADIQKINAEIIKMSKEIEMIDEDIKTSKLNRDKMRAEIRQIEANIVNLKADTDLKLSQKQLNNIRHRFESATFEDRVRIVKIDAGLKSLGYKRGVLEFASEERTEAFVKSVEGVIGKEGVGAIKTLMPIVGAGVSILFPAAGKFIDRAINKEGPKKTSTIKDTYNSAGEHTGTTTTTTWK